VYVDDSERRQVDHGLRNDLAVTHHHHGLRLECAQEFDGFGQPHALRLADADPFRAAASFTGGGDGCCPRPRGRSAGSPPPAPGAQLHHAFQRGDAKAGVPRKTRRIAGGLSPTPGALEFLDLALHQVALQRADVGDVKAAIEVVVSCRNARASISFAGLSNSSPRALRARP